MAWAVEQPGARHSQGLARAAHVPDASAPATLTSLQKSGGEPMPRLTRLRSKPRQRAERSSQRPGLRKQLETPSCKAQPWERRASRSAPRVGC
eukprot:15482886-Alexandrium_andersonii.AAC.1